MDTPHETSALHLLPDNVLVRVATFVASNCVENPKGAIERLLKLRASKPKERAL
jgi:hypothetical protein